MYVQAGLRLCCSQTPEDRFSRVKAHKKFDIDYALLYTVQSLKKHISLQHVNGYNTQIYHEILQRYNRQIFHL